MFKKEEGPNRKARRTYAARARSRKPTPKYLSADWDMKKEMIKQKVTNRIAKVKARKLERLAKEEVDGKPTKKKKVSQAELKQIRKRVKRIKFLNKVKKIIS